MAAKPAAPQGEDALKPHDSMEAAKAPHTDGTLSEGSTASANSASGTPAANGLHSAGSLESKGASATGSTAANPYARPLGAVPAPQTPAQESHGPDASARRRSTRMQRYHAAGGDDEGNNT